MSLWAVWIASAWEVGFPESGLIRASPRRRAEDRFDTQWVQMRTCAFVGHSAGAPRGLTAI